MTDFEPPDTPVHVESDQARAGESTGRVRYILAISFGLAVVILALIVWGPLLFRK
jgi:hypothetical protein